MRIAGHVEIFVRYSSAGNACWTSNLTGSDGVISGIMANNRLNAEADLLLGRWHHHGCSRNRRNHFSHKWTIEPNDGRPFLQYCCSLMSIVFDLSSLFIDQILLHFLVYFFLQLL